MADAGKSRCSNTIVDGLPNDIDAGLASANTSRPPMKRRYFNRENIALMLAARLSPPSPFGWDNALLEILAFRGNRDYSYVSCYCRAVRLNQIPALQECFFLLFPQKCWKIPFFRIRSPSTARLAMKRGRNVAVNPESHRMQRATSFVSLCGFRSSCEFIFLKFCRFVVERCSAAGSWSDVVARAWDRRGTLRPPQSFWHWTDAVKVKYRTFLV